ncbi:DUF4175 domain-containing protein [Burkholderia sp. Ap-962]|nr:DUF4175 domain-containing protein [Burkholderia sp. Ap-962]NIF70986.1 DUF4175 domain-containing protein [Burkholderia sp. Ap-962]
MTVDAVSFLLGCGFASAVFALARWGLRRFRRALEQLERDGHVHHD